MNQYIFKNKTTVLTGGASGIGLALANKLAELGSDLAIIDCNDIALKKVCDDLKSKYPKLEISGYKLDLSKISEIYNIRYFIYWHTHFQWEQEINWIKYITNSLWYYWLS